MHPEPSASQGGSVKPIDHAELRNYKERIIVAGSRGYDDYAGFSKLMLDYLEGFVDDKESLVFISGNARSGADALIIRWCKEHGYPWAEFDAAWDDLNAPGAVIMENKFGKQYNAVAGYDRNDKMATVGTKLVIFWDGLSKGTKQMRERAGERKLKIVTILIDIVKKVKDHGWKQTSSGKDNPGVHREAPAW